MPQVTWEQGGHSIANVISINSCERILGSYLGVTWVYLPSLSPKNLSIKVSMFLSATDCAVPSTLGIKAKTWNSFHFPSDIIQITWEPRSILAVASRPRMPRGKVENWKALQWRVQGLGLGGKDYGVGFQGL